MNLEERVQTALDMSDMDEIGDALHQLWLFHKPEARSVCLKILHDKLGDVYYQASAFETLYDIDYVEAVNYIKHHALTEDGYVLKSMLYSVGADLTTLDERPEVKGVIDVLKRTLALRPSSEIEKLKEAIAYFGQG